MGASLQKKQAHGDVLRLLGCEALLQRTKCCPGGNDVQKECRIALAGMDVHIQPVHNAHGVFEVRVLVFHIVEVEAGQVAGEAASLTGIQGILEFQAVGVLPVTISEYFNGEFFGHH